MNVSRFNPSGLPRGEPSSETQPPGVGWLSAGVVLVALMTLWLLTYPFQFQDRAVTPFLGEWGLANIHKINLASNLVLFAPLGCAWVWWRRLARGGAGVGAVVAAALVCGVLSLIGEALQTRLPGRTSSAIDLVANILGGGGGAIVGYLSADLFSRRWRAAAAWLAPRAATQRGLVALTILLAVRTAPFDVSLETYYLRQKWEQETKLSVPPFAATRQWIADDKSQGATAAQTRQRALYELGGAAGAAVLFFALAWCAGRAGGDIGKAGCAYSVMTLGVCMAILLATEVAQFFVRSRLMDCTDLFAGGASVLAAVALESVTRRRNATAQNRQASVSGD